MTPDARLTQQFDFLLEVDKLKQVLRATPISDNSRRENSGEHSWHIALYAMVLSDHAGPDVRIDRVIRMLLIHDIVEVDAGDAPIHGSHDVAAQDARERAAAERIFGLLPADQGDGLRALWEEFEASDSPDAIFAKSIDRLQPLLLNHASGGGSWIEYSVTLDQLDTRIGTKIARGAPRIWSFVRARVAPFFNK